MSLLAVVAVTGATGVAAVNANSGSSPKNSDPNGYSKDQCKNGGWKEMGYRNQGQCVSHFASGGRSDH